MSNITVTPLPAKTFETIPLEDAVDLLKQIDESLAIALPRINEMHADRQRLLTTIDMHMRARKATKYPTPSFVLTYENVGSASVDAAVSLRISLAETDVPPSEIEAALPYVQPDPVIKPNLRRVRKLAEYGDEVRAIVERHIVEPRQRLVIVPIAPKNVTPEPEALKA